MNKIIKDLNEFGLDASLVMPDNKIKRCNSSAKNGKNTDGWYIIKEHHGHYYCHYGCWIRGESKQTSTVDNGNSYDSSVWKELSQIAAREAKERERSGIIKASAFITSCSLANNHEYLDTKKIQPCGVLKYGSQLVVPIRNSHGDITSYQTISPSGEKLFMSDGVVSGGCFPIQGDESVVCVCEGFATGASIHEATGYKVLVALNAGNLRKVVKIARIKFKKSTIVLCADNDHSKKQNVGLETGKRVADEFGLSCVWPTGIKGSDFNDMALELGLNAVRLEICRQKTIEVLTPEDFVGENLSLKIPNEAVPAGLIAEGMEALEGDIIQYDLPLVLTVIARAIAGKICFNGVHPNLFNIKVGGTSTGKTASDKRFLQCLDIENFVSLSDIASGPGLLRGIAGNPQGMAFFDEITNLFRRNTKGGGADIIADGKSDALLDIFSRSGQSFKKTYADNRNVIEIINPCFNLIGNATPGIFDEIQPKDFETGLMQRFDFWYYDGPILPKKLLERTYFNKILKFIQRLRDLMVTEQPKTAGVSGLIQYWTFMGITEDAKSCLQEYSEDIIAKSNLETSPGLVGFISRRFDLSIKYALIHHAACSPHLYSPLCIQDIKYGILLAELLGGWKSNVLSSKVSSGDFHKDCETFKEAIRAATQSGREGPTFTYLATRKINLKNWLPKYSESVITVLKKRGEIITKEGPRNTKYYLPRKTEE